MLNRKPLVHPEFVIPDTFEAHHFVLSMLTIHDVVRDYDAVMSSAEHLKATFSDVYGWTWPDGLTLEEDLVDLGWHQREFTIRRSFAYKVESPDRSTYLGCIYINATLKRDFDAMIMLWVRTSELESGLDQDLFTAVKSWVAKVWPFEQVAYPGRDISAADWKALPECN